MTEIETRACLSILASKARKITGHADEQVVLTGTEFMALWKLLKDSRKRICELEKES